MNMWQRVSLLLVFLVVAVSASVTAVIAQSSSPFETTLQTTYSINETGSTKVSHEFAVKNLEPTMYLKEYSLKTHFPKLTQISATSNTESISPQVSTENNTTTITIPFSDQIVGQNKVRQFKVEYVIENMAMVAGQVLELQLTPLTSPEQYKQHTIKVRTPLRFGRAVRVKPEPSSVTIDNQEIVTTFDQTSPQAISAFYGDRQIYTLTLRYNLENNSSSQGIAQIALPPDTPFQRVHYHALEPPADELKRDDDGNWLASYKLAPNTTSAVYLTADVLVTLDPQPDIPVLPPLPDHTAEKKFWEVSNPQIKSLSEKHSTVEAAYRYVLETLKYSFNTVNTNSINRRLGAVNALQEPTNAVCQEFTDLFISLVRAQKVPARRLTGFAYTQNPELRPLSLETDVLHAWPEYYDQQANIWKQVDPTWESTTGGVNYFSQFDLNHVVFAINGKSSTTPYPAGAYKGTDLSTKDVEVGFVSTFPNIEPQFSLTAKPYQMGGLQLPGKYTLLIQNTTAQAWYDIRVTIKHPESSAIELSTQELNLPVLLPNQLYSQPLTVVSNEWKPGNTVDLQYHFSVLKRDNTNIQGSVNVQTGPTIIKSATQQNFYLAMGIGVVICVFGAWSLLVFGSRRKRSVRR